MKKIGLILCVFGFVFAVKIFAQQTPPPAVEMGGDEENAPDLAVQKIPAPKKKEGTTDLGEKKKGETPPQKLQVAPEKPIELPAQPTATTPATPPAAEIKTPPPPAPPPPTQVQEAPKAPEIKVPANTAVVQVSPLAETQAQQDGGPFKDAGSDLQTALPITFSIYEDNSLSSADTIDVFKLFTRAKEGVGVILKPQNPASQLACELLSENGELLSQTQAPKPGDPLSFQTSPFEKNGVIYLRVKDTSLTAETLASDVRHYSLELKPIAALAEIAPPATQAEAKPQVPQPNEKKKKPVEVPEGNSFNWVLYGLIGVGVAGVALLSIILMKKIRKKQL